MVLCSCSEERDASYVYLFDRGGEGTVGFGGLEDEWVEVTDD